MVDCLDCQRPRPHRGRGLCGSCYNRRWKHQAFDGAPPKRSKPPGPHRHPAEHGTLKGWYQHQHWGTPYCDPCRAARRRFLADWRQDNIEAVRERDRQWKADSRRRRAEGTISVPSVIFDVLETAGTSMLWRSLSAWVLELHPEWAEATVKRTLFRLVKEGRVERVEFGDELRYRL